MAEERKSSNRPDILHYNDDIRNKMLRFNYWNDKTYLQFGGDYVRYAMSGKKNEENSFNSPAYNGMSLYDYTYNSDSKYGQDIISKYLNPKLKHKAYEYYPTLNNISSLNGEYQDTFTGDNKLQLTGDLMHDELISLSHYANADRFLRNKYITPSMADIYGSSFKIEGARDYISSNLFNTIGGVYKHDSGRLDDLSINGNVRFGDISNLDNISDNGGVYFINKIFDKADKIYGDYGNPLYRYDARNNNALSGNTNTYQGFTITNGVVYHDEFDARANGLNFIYNELDNINTRKGEHEFNSYFGSEDRPEENYYFYKEYENKDSLLDKTVNLFNEHKISTLVGRFHTSKENGITYKKEFTDTAKTDEFGNSHGRNLLKLKATKYDNTNGYQNPYCRVWTYHHQYNSYRKLIRPFTTDNGPMTVSELQDRVGVTKSGNHLRAIGDDYNNYGGAYLADNTVLTNEGLARITPSFQDGKKKVSDCMFSIENLAWKDVPKNRNYLSREQIGPNGGRIMWFPPYDLDFHESVNVDWDENSFIGRGEKIYTYKDTNRNGSLSFTLLIDHPSIINDMKYRKSQEDVDTKENVEQDILRFFAGCQPPDEINKYKYSDNGSNGSIDSDGEKNGINESLGKTKHNNSDKIIFYVYFPNNYSGYGAETKKNSSTPSDGENWYHYILVGNGLDTEGNRIGFEMAETPSNGISREMKLAWESSGKPKNSGIIPTISSSSECYHWIKLDKLINVNSSPDDNKDPFEHGYHFMVDFDLHQKMHYNRSYSDDSSYALNSKLSQYSYNDATCSFAEFLLAADSRVDGDSISQNKNILHLGGEYEYVKECTVENLDRVKSINKLLNGKVSEVKILGYASVQDSKHRGNCSYSNSQLLALRRSWSVEWALRNILGNDANVINETKSRIDSINNSGNGSQVKDPVENERKDSRNEKFDSNDNNAVQVKRTKYVRVEITLNEPNSVPLSDTTNAVSEIGDGVALSMNNANEKHDYDYGNFDEFLSSVNKGAITGDYKSDIETRYETESEYFERIKYTDPLVFKTITDKYRYFDPAFHSMSPEGFNARLTFLHQCTRQGHTIEPKDSNGKATAAGNLSFGRMPVCVLRIGDFINTKVIIKSVSIDYKNGNGIQWDLNPEGIGVQPMMAKVSLDISIIGGQSLNAPISRLQNAVTFNYYANTGVYDDRSDRVRLNYTLNTDKNENVNGLSREEYTRLWTPYNDLNMRD